MMELLELLGYESLWIFAILTMIAITIAIVVFSQEKKPM